MRSKDGAPTAVADRKRVAQVLWTWGMKEVVPHCSRAVAPKGRAWLRLHVRPITWGRGWIPAVVCGMMPVLSLLLGVTTRGVGKVRRRTCRYEGVGRRRCRGFAAIPFKEPRKRCRRLISQPEALVCVWPRAD